MIIGITWQVRGGSFHESCGKRIESRDMIEECKFNPTNVSIVPKFSHLIASRSTESKNRNVAFRHATTVSSQHDVLLSIG